MGGGLLQLAAYGAQDVYLTGNPQITFWKVVYRRHTNFAMESIEQTFNNDLDFGKKVTCTVSRNGDLVHKMYLQVTLPKLEKQQRDGTGSLVSTGGTDYYAYWVNGIGHALIQSVEVEIGGQKLDKHYSEWLDFVDELYLPEDKREGYWEMIGKSLSDTPVTDDTEEVTLFIPMQFWFCRNPGLALPMIALQFHELKLNFEIRSLASLLKSDDANWVLTDVSTPLNIKSASLWVDYIYLDTDERRRFAQVSHEYLIEQVQFTGAESVPANSQNHNIKINFNHPIKELVWVVQANSRLQQNQVGEGNELFRYDGATDGSDPLMEAKLILNGHDRFSARKAKYFRLVQPYQHHTKVSQKQIYCYSFALKPEDHQPSGTCNFSRIDNAVLNLKLEDNNLASTIKVFAFGYNVLRIMSGMAGLAYSN